MCSRTTASLSVVGLLIEAAVEAEGVIEAGVRTRYIVEGASCKFLGRVEEGSGGEGAILPVQSTVTNSGMPDA